MWIFFSILVSALVFKSEKKFQNISWPVSWSFQWIETWQMWSYYPSPSSPVPHPRQLRLTLRSLSRRLASFCSQQSLELLILSEHGPSPCFSIRTPCLSCAPELVQVPQDCLQYWHPRWLHCFLILALDTRHCSCGSPEVPRKNQGINFYRSS